MPLPAWVMDATGNIVVANRQWQVTFGFAQHLNEALHPEEADRWKIELAAARDARRPFSGEYHLLTNGQVRRFMLNAVPQEAGHWLCTATDMEGLLTSLEAQFETECEKLAAANAQTEVALRLTSQQFHAFFEQGAVGMILVGLEGEILAVNPAFCRFFDYSESELLSMSAGQLRHPEESERLKQAYEELRRGDCESANIEARFLRKDGQTLWLLTSLALIRDSRGHALYFTGIVQDVTGEKGGRLMTKS